MAVDKPALMTGSVMMNRELAAGIFLISLRLPVAFPAPDPGQFVMIKVGEGRDPLLRRPFSIHAFRREEDYAVLEILYRVVGRGTRLLASLKGEATLGVMGPLGRGFTLIPERKNIIVVAGGIGIAPLSFLIQQYRDLIRDDADSGGLFRRVICYFGTATADLLVGLEKIEACCEDIRVATDDGSCGYRGNVLSLFGRDLAFYNPADAVVYSCGPLIMLKQLAKMLQEKDFFCQVSMEERMACGLGACLGCAVAGRKPDGQKAYRRVCKDGPVFNLQEVDWHA